MPGDCEPELAPHRRVILRALGDFLGELHVDPEGEGGRVLEHAHVAEQLHARPLPVALAGEAEGKLLVVERPPKGALGPAEVGDQLRLVALRRVEGDREVVQGGVIAAELVDGKLHVAKRLSKALSAGGRLVAADERRHEAARVELAPSLDPRIDRLSGRGLEEGRGELVDELPGDRGLPQDAERADDLPALHQVLDDGLVVVQERCQVHELVEAAVAREQVARGRAVEDVLVLGEEIPQLIHELLALGVALAGVLEERAVDAVELQLCQPGSNHGGLGAVLARKSLKLLPQELVERSRIANLHEPEGDLLEGWLRDVEPGEQPRGLHVVLGGKRGLRLLRVHLLPLLAGEAVRHRLLVVRLRQEDPPHVPVLLSDAYLVERLRREHEPRLARDVLREPKWTPDEPPRRGS
mmetsp:Transcript_38750/g.91791  ORF Transcript_38750/g.91791 Transcript_38750/m.91791 type:complete len:411 (+) Transcript_38750:980-2212(+)